MSIRPRCHGLSLTSVGRLAHRLHAARLVKEGITVKLVAIAEDQPRVENGVSLVRPTREGLQIAVWSRVFFSRWRTAATAVAPGKNPPLRKRAARLLR